MTSAGGVYVNVGPVGYGPYTGGVRTGKNNDGASVRNGSRDPMPPVGGDISDPNGITIGGGTLRGAVEVVGGGGSCG